MIAAWATLLAVSVARPMIHAALFVDAAILLSVFLTALWLAHVINFATRVTKNTPSSIKEEPADPVRLDRRMALGHAMRAVGLAAISVAVATAFPKTAAAQTSCPAGYWSCGDGEGNYICCAENQRCEGSGEGMSCVS
jgi:hypothetical protein